MARKRSTLTQKHGAMLEELAHAGKPAGEIAAALAAAGAKGLSRATVARRLKELRGPRRARVAPAPKPSSDSSRKVSPAIEPPPLPATPEAIPDGTDLQTLDRWLETAERAARKAETDGNLAGLGAMGRLAKGLLDARRRATPPEPPDPNDDPDMVKLGAEVAERFHKFIAEAIGGTEEATK